MFYVTDVDMDTGLASGQMPYTDGIMNDSTQIMALAAMSFPMTAEKVPLEYLEQLDDGPAHVMLKQFSELMITGKEAAESLAEHVSNTDGLNHLAPCHGNMLARFTNEALHRRKRKSASGARGAQDDRQEIDAEQRGNGRSALSDAKTGTTLCPSMIKYDPPRSLRDDWTDAIQRAHILFAVGSRARAPELIKGGQLMVGGEMCTIQHPMKEIASEIMKIATRTTMLASFPTAYVLTHIILQIHVEKFGPVMALVIADHLPVKYIQNPQYGVRRGEFMTSVHSALAMLSLETFEARTQGETIERRALAEVARLAELLHVKCTEDQVEFQRKETNVSQMNAAHMQLQQAMGHHRQDHGGGKGGRSHWQGGEGKPSTAVPE